MTEQPEKISGHLDPGRPVSSLDSAEREHLFSCPFCQARLAKFVEERELISAPGHMKETILSQCVPSPVSLPQVSPKKRHSKKLDLFFYSLRVGSAVACSLALLAFMPALSGRADQRAEAASRLSAPEDRQDFRLLDYTSEQMERITEQITQIINQGVFRYDKKEK